MPRESTGILVRGDKSAVSFIRHICSPSSSRGDGQAPATWDLDETHIFCSGGQAVEKWLEDQIDKFVAQNLLEPPEDTATFNQGPDVKAKSTRPKQGQKRSAASQLEASGS
eukprot:TRINITY_DN25800_c0_g1_i1.p1 TRINITY_DN25800_c0_g1~~TRINITY_DN25800_c0_g1_i1.p1  ORF type:complete len:128 (-),score=25.06 TRINITY_DN25800_c0_g1_i1:23-355(-)